LTLLNSQTGEEQLLASYYLVDSPVFSPGGSAILFSAKEGPASKSQLYSIDLASLKVRKITTAEEAGEPTWGPLY
jgi:Tol biopolymer transport system component